MSYKTTMWKLIKKLESSIDVLSNLAHEESHRVETEKREALKLPSEEEKIEKFHDVAESDKSLNYYAMINTLKNSLSIVKNEIHELNKKG
jgi:hypothetical protein